MRCDVYVHRHTDPSAVAKPSNWNTLFAYTGKDDAASLRALGVQGHLNDAVQYVQTHGCVPVPGGVLAPARVHLTSQVCGSTTYLS